MSEALATITVTDEQLALIKKTIAPDATKEELELFLYDCKRQGVHPLDRMIYFTKRKGKYTPITSIDFMRQRAAETGEMAGSEDPVFVTDPDGKLISATTTVYRITQGQRFAYTATARWAEYYPGDGADGFMWRRMSHTMLGKCSEALSLRKAFPKQLAKLYAKEEMDQAGREDRTPSLTDPITDEAPGPTNGAAPAKITTKCPECGQDTLVKSKYPPRKSEPGTPPGWWCAPRDGGCNLTFYADDPRITGVIVPERTDEEQRELAQAQTAEEERDRTIPAEIAFPHENEQEERDRLHVDIVRLAKKLKWDYKKRIETLQTYGGGQGATVQNIDLAALVDMVNFMRSRCSPPEPVWGKEEPA